MHRAKQIAPRECGWKHGDSGYSAEKKHVHKKPRIDLTPTGLLMEGDYTFQPCDAGFSVKWCDCFANHLGQSGSTMYTESQGLLPLWEYFVGNITAG